MEFTPDLAQKFDCEIEVNIVGWKTISLRVGGTVEQPCVDVDVVSRRTLKQLFWVKYWALYALHSHLSISEHDNETCETIFILILYNLLFFFIEGSSVRWCLLRCNCKATV